MRRLTTLFRPLFAGLCVTVALAWVFALWPLHTIDLYAPPSLRGQSSLGPNAWMFVRTSSLGSTDFASSVQGYSDSWTFPPSPELIPAWSIISRRNPRDAATRLNSWDASQVELARGFPFRALYAVRSADASGGLDWLCLHPYVTDPWRGAFVFPGWTSSHLWTHDGRILPLSPLWPGLIADTLFWGGIIHYAPPLLGSVRRRWRVRRSLCPHCAYDLRARPSVNAPCPECGKISA